MACPLCGAAGARASWLGALRYEGRDFPYAECTSCLSLYADPMPDEATLGRMYGPQYATVADGPGVTDPKEPQRVAAWLEQHGRGTFIDYGCGAGHLLIEARRAGWEAIGVEFDPGVAGAAARRTGARVADRFTVAELLSQPSADVLHLGDVIEHLTDPAADVRRISGMLKPGGYLLAQGPLEAQPTLFTQALKLTRRLRGAPSSEMPPYHVTLATAAGQQALFRQCGLETVHFEMWEVDWPAPSRLTGAEVFRARSVALFALRRLSQLVSSLQPARWGNRYFYVGRRV